MKIARILVVLGMLAASSAWGQSSEELKVLREETAKGFEGLGQRFDSVETLLQQIEEGITAGNEKVVDALKKRDGSASRSRRSGTSARSLSQRLARLEGMVRTLRREYARSRDGRWDPTVRAMRQLLKELKDAGTLTDEQCNRISEAMAKLPAPVAEKAEGVVEGESGGEEKSAPAPPKKKESKQPAAPEEGVTESAYPPYPSNTGARTTLAQYIPVQGQTDQEVPGGKQEGQAAKPAIWEITVLVRRPDGDGVEGIRIVLKDEDGKELFSGITKEKGTVKFRKKPDGGNLFVAVDRATIPHWLYPSGNLEAKVENSQGDGIVQIPFDFRSMQDIEYSFKGAVSVTVPEAEITKIAKATGSEVAAGVNKEISVEATFSPWVMRALWAFIALVAVAVVGIALFLRAVLKADSSRD